jgi:predicted TIM-barrel fold metal-dependent hydrolase
VFDPTRHAYDAARTYTPGEASVQSLAGWQDGLGIVHTVLVQPSVYGTDNGCLLAALASLGPQRARGIAVVADEGPRGRVLESMQDAGVRGVRLNIEVASCTADTARARLRALRWLRGIPGWCLQLHASLPLTLALLDDLAALGVPVVMDHYAGIHKQPPGQARAWAPLLDFLRDGPGYVKLSAPYRSQSGWDGAALAELAVTLTRAAPGRILWGSDWPHTGGEAGRPRDPLRIEPFRPIDNAAVLSSLAAALGPGAMQALLVDNPLRLYGFSKGATSA